MAPQTHPPNPAVYSLAAALDFVFAWVSPASGTLLAHTPQPTPSSDEDDDEDEEDDRRSGGGNIDPDDDEGGTDDDDDDEDDTLWARRVRNPLAD
jgi:hypothetical protein